jgi:ABC-type phosphate/phosphonate transport system permease subunit
LELHTQLLLVLAALVGQGQAQGLMVAILYFLQSLLQAVVEAVTTLDKMVVLEAVAAVAAQMAAVAQEYLVKETLAGL